jgi:hypothetical protein
MRQYSQISVRVSEEILDLFLSRLAELLSASWDRDTEVESRSNDLVRCMNVQYMHYVRKSKPHAELVFLYKADEFRLINAFTDGNGISMAAHGKLTDDFWRSGLRQVCKELGLSGSRTAPKTVKPEAGLPVEVADALYRFAICVNKSDGGTSHPDDMALWSGFVLASHMAGVKMEEENLHEYLETKKFPEEAVMALLHGYDIGLQMLRMYDHVLAMEPAAKVN